MYRDSENTQKRECNSDSITVVTDIPSPAPRLEEDHITHREQQGLLSMQHMSFQQRLEGLRALVGAWRARRARLPQGTLTVHYDSMDGQMVTCDVLAENQDPVTSDRSTHIVADLVSDSALSSCAAHAEAQDVNPLPPSPPSRHKHLVRPERRESRRSAALKPSLGCSGDRGHRGFALSSEFCDCLLSGRSILGGWLSGAISAVQSLVDTLPRPLRVTDKADLPDVDPLSQPTLAAVSARLGEMTAEAWRAGAECTNTMDAHLARPIQGRVR